MVCHCQTRARAVYDTSHCVPPCTATPYSQTSSSGGIGASIMNALTAPGRLLNGGLRLGRGSSIGSSSGGFGAGDWDAVDAAVGGGGGGSGGGVGVSAQRPSATRFWPGERVLAAAAAAVQGALPVGIVLSGVALADSVRGRLRFLTCCCMNHGGFGQSGCNSCVNRCGTRQAALCDAVHCITHGFDMKTVSLARHWSCVHGAVVPFEPHACA